LIVALIQWNAHTFGRMTWGTVLLENVISRLLKAVPNDIFQAFFQHISYLSALSVLLTNLILPTALLVVQPQSFDLLKTELFAQCRQDDRLHYFCMVNTVQNQITAG
jgi:hypothetical protein